ncbi:phage tail tape measure protein [Martelella mangrovi]|uniref:Bacteriophage tail tape measure C-terminal domain-containing protein n=1 Tax=Martelella mangrovi TaxID=1397477 RepID=A0ABV2IGY6_9HYPH
MTRIRMQARTAANDTASSFMSIKKKVGGLDGIFGVLRGGPAGLAASLGLGVMVSETQKAVNAVADLGKAAKTAGVDFEVFQELRYAAVKSRIELNALTDGLKEMQLRADEFVKTGGGSAAESFKRLGVNARDLTRMLRDPAAMFDTLIGKIRLLDRAAQIRVLDEIFGGTAAEQFSSLMDESVQSIADARQEARDMGAVMDDELLRKANDINAAWETMALVIGTNVKGALVDIASLMGDLWVSIDEFTAILMKIPREMENIRDAGEMMGSLASMRPGDSDLGVVKGGRVNPGATQEEIDANNEELRKQLDASSAITQEIDRQNSLTTEQLALEREINSLRGQYETAGAYYTEDLLKQKAQETIDAKAARKTSRRTGGKGGGGSASTAIDREREAVEKLIQALQDELQMSEMTADQKKVFENLRRAGTAATDAEKASIRELTLAIEEQKDKQEAAADTADFFRDTARDSFMALVPAIETGNAALDTLINKLIEAAAQAALFGDGPLGGLFGGGLLSGFLPAHATGTNFTQGGMALVGERGPEILNLPRGGEVIPHHRVAAALHTRGAAASGTVNNINFGGISIAMQEGTKPEDAAANGQEVRRQLDQFARHELPVLIQKHQRNPNRR